MCPEMQKGKDSSFGQTLPKKLSKISLTPNGSRKENGEVQKFHQLKRWKMVQMAKKRVEETEKEDDQARRKIAKERMQEDTRNGGATAHKAGKSALGAKKEYVQPTHTIKTEEGINSDPNQVHKAFTEECAKRCSKCKGKNQIGTISKKNTGSTYPKYLTRTVQSTGRICFKLSNNGKDGSRVWRIHELKALGVEAWQQRSRIVEIQLKEGKVPASYKQVSTPMMPKAKGTEVYGAQRASNLLHFMEGGVGCMVPTAGPMAGGMAPGRNTRSKNRP